MIEEAPGGLFVKMSFRGGGLFGRGGGLNGRGAYKIMQKSIVCKIIKKRFQHNINTTYLSKSNKNKH